MTDLLDMAWDLVYEASEKIDSMPSSEKEDIGDVAFEYIADYPLYSATSNISYDEAILTALVVGRGDFICKLKERKIIK